MAQNQMFSNKMTRTPFTLTIIAPIRPGASEAWRRYLQELTGSRLDEYEAFCQRWGIAKEQIWIIETLKGAVTIITVATIEPGLRVEQWVNCDLPFERQFREQLLLVQGFDLTNLSVEAPIELVLDWLGPTEPYSKGGVNE
jgi:hypothetical protein